jgi:hypothetical protein
VHDRDSRGGKHSRLELQGDLFRMLKFAEADVNCGNGYPRNANGPGALALRP